MTIGRERDSNASRTNWPRSYKPNTVIVESQRIQAENLNQLMQTIRAYVESSNGRMKRDEDNLGGLIRAITAEHTNGRSKP